MINANYFYNSNLEKIITGKNSQDMNDQDLEGNQNYSGDSADEEDGNEMMNKKGDSKLIKYDRAE